MEEAVSRLHLLDKSEVDPEYHDLYGAGMNVHRQTLHSPKLARLSRDMGLYFRNQCKLDLRLRELAVLQVAYSARSPYEYSHHIKIALDGGVDPREILAIAAETAGRTSDLDPLARAALAAARQLVAGAGVSDDVFAVLKQNLHEELVVDLLFLISFYCGFVRFTGALEIQVEPSYETYLEAFPLHE